MKLGSTDGNGETDRAATGDADAPEAGEGTGLDAVGLAAAFNLNVKELYNGRTQLQRKGLWPKIRKTHRREPQLLAVEVAAQSRSTMPAAVNEWMFRITGPGGWAMECRQLPEVSWLRGLSAALSDASP